MITLFDYSKISPNDQSIAYLGQIFGRVGTILPTNASTIFAAMFQTINASVLILGVIIVTHTAVTGLLKTAQSGEFLGKWDSMWVPIRTVGGVAALFPTATGYSLLQIAMMWFIVQGVGAADKLWVTVLNYVQLMGSVYSTVSTPGGGADSSGMGMQFGTLFQGITCQATERQKYNFKNGFDKYYDCGEGNAALFCTQTDTKMLDIVDPAAPQVKVVSAGAHVTMDDGNTITAPGGNIQYSMGEGGNCGTLSYADPLTYVDVKGDKRVKDVIDAYNSQYHSTGSSPPPPTLPTVCSTNPQPSNDIITECASYQGQQKALQDIVNVYHQIAMQFVTADYQYINFYYNKLAAPPPAPAWLLSYCATLGISNAQCCYDAAGGVTQCVAQLPQYSNSFPLPNAATGGLVNDNNVSTDVINKIIWPSNMQAYLGSNTDIKKYATDYLVGGMAAAVATAAASTTPTLTGWEVQAKNQGWLVAGAYYYILAGAQSKNVAASQANFSVPNAGDTLGKTDYRNNYSAAAALLTAINPPPPSSLSSSPAVAEIANVFNGSMDGLVNSFMGTLTGQGNDPVTGIVNLGQKLILSATIIYPIYITISTVFITAGSINVVALGTGLTGSPWGEGLKAMFGLLTPLVMAYCAFCFSFGGMLAVYIPLIPYTIFIFGAIGWLIATLEAMIAAPFVALGILSPGGQSEMLGRAEPAMMILFNTFLRPMLMIFGMVAAMLMTKAVVTLINSGFATVVGEIIGNPTPVEAILFLVSYTMLIITAINKCFSLIHLVPERVLTWIGGQAISYGEGESLHSVKGGFESGAASVAGGAKGAGGAVEGFGQGVAKAKNTKMDEEKRAEQGGGAGATGKEKPGSINLNEPD
jgi:hypothetical protein